MKTDTFTKILLTIIAINLTILTFMKLNIVPKVYANNTSSYLENNTDIQYGLVPLNEDGSITVKLANSDEIDVNITEISTSDKLNVSIQEIDTWDKMNVNIDEIKTRDRINVKVQEVDGSAFFFCTVPVKIKE